MLDKKIRKQILEIKEKKEKLLIEEKIIKTRIISIFESEENIKNFSKLPKQKREKIAFAFYGELNRLNESNLINEGFGDMLAKIFGNSFYGILEGLIEPLVDSILGGLGLSGYFKKFLVSLLTTNPAKLVAAFKDCRAMTELVAASVSEALAMMVQEELNMGGTGYGVIRNILGKTFKESQFINSLSDSLENFVCELFSKFTGKATEVYNKLKPATAG